MIQASATTKGKNQMTKKIIKPVLIGALVCLLGLAACSSPTLTLTSTPDLNPFRTEVAATVFAQVTQDLALTPSATPIPSDTATTTPTPTALSTLTQVTGSSPVITATLVNLTPVVGLLDKAQWVSQSIADDSVFAPGEAFTMTWTLQNVGASTWTPAYLLRFYSGDLFGAAKEILLGQQVPPGATVNITIKMRAPATPGKYRTDWVLSNEKRSNFKEPVYLMITIARPATPTRTPTPVPTPTP
jgi:hypothetical protein